MAMHSSIAWMELTFFNQSPIVKCLGWFQFFFLISHAVMHTLAAKPLCMFVSLVLNSRSWIVWTKTAVTLIGTCLVYVPLRMAQNTWVTKISSSCFSHQASGKERGEGSFCSLLWEVFLYITACYKFEGKELGSSYILVVPSPKY